MARVNMEEIVDHLSIDVRKALNDAVKEVSADSNIDERELFRAFKRAIRRKCNTWESVPDNYVKCD